MQNNESLKQQRLNQLIGQQREEALRQATSHSPQRDNRRGATMTGAAHECARICHSHKPANLQGVHTHSGGSTLM